MMGFGGLLATLIGGCGASRRSLPEPGERPEPVRATFTVDGAPVVVHALPTGTVTIKACHHTGCLPEATPYPLRFAAILADRRFAPPMPVWTYLIEHPEGRFLVDAGAVPDVRNAATWGEDPGAYDLVSSFLRLDVTPQETVPARLAALGIGVDTVRAVVLTHQHLDHTGAVPAFRGADVWTARAEDAASQWIGAFPWRWRDAERRVRFVDDEGAPGELGPTVPLTADRHLSVILTGGHTPGSLTVRLDTDQGTLWFTGDVAFTAADLHPEAPTAGIHTDLAAVRRLHGWFHDRREHVLPAHDPDVPTRLLAAAGGAGSAAGDHAAP